MRQSPPAFAQRARYVWCQQGGGNPSAPFGALADHLAASFPPAQLRPNRV